MVRDSISADHALAAERTELTVHAAVDRTATARRDRGKREGGFDPMRNFDQIQLSGTPPAARASAVRDNPYW